MSAVVVIEAVAIVLLVVLVSGLLRSHADILRALHGLGVDLDGSAGDPAPPGVDGRRRPDRAGRIGGVGAMSAVSGRAASDLSGVSPADEALRIAVTSVHHDTLLAFLTTGCTTCAVFWQALAEPRLAVPGGARVVVVVHSADEESISRVQSLAPRKVPVVMSSAAWDDYSVAFAPYFVYVAGESGQVVGEGAAGTWGELASLLGQAIGDATATGPRAANGGPGHRPGPVGQLGDWDRGRERRIDEDLLQAGIAPGDPQLYPTRLDPSPSAGTDGPVPGE